MHSMVVRNSDPFGLANTGSISNGPLAHQLQLHVPVQWAWAATMYYVCCLTGSVGFKRPHVVLRRACGSTRLRKEGRVYRQC